MARPDWDSYFMQIAEVVATRGTCDRKQVGCVIVRDREILSAGYNGSIRGHAHCDDVGHDMLNGHCVRTVHAESNAIAQAARRGTALEGATIYTTTFPCLNCFKLLVQSGIVNILFRDHYSHNDQTKRVIEYTKFGLDHGHSIFLRRL